MKTIRKLDRFSKCYPLFSQERDFIDEVGFWIKRATKSPIPDCELELTNAYVNVYEIKSEGKNYSIIKTLRKIIQDSYNNLANKNYIRGK